MTDNPTEMLVQEVDDYLDAGPVGLYEFIWILNGQKVPGSPDELRHYAKRALHSLLETKRGRLVQMVWAEPESLSQLDRDIDDSDFEDPQEDVPYVAIARS